jgi:serine/threonine-protein kinase
MSNSSPPPKSDLPQLQKYQITKLIGQGQFGRVFRAIHKESGQVVALKELDRQRFPTHKFLRELHCLSTLQHPNIVTWQALEYSPSGRYIVMDYCEGGSLRSLMKAKANQLSLSESLTLIAEILSGLEHAHSRNIIHCDIKPENILLSSKDATRIARISDFGIARFREEVNPDGSLTTGSPAYMAPERFYGKYSPASDLYAVGVMLFELVVGERPFSGLPGELMSAHLNRPVNIPNTIPFLVRSIITKALQKLPPRRYTYASEMLQAVRMVIDVEKAVDSSVAGYAREGESQISASSSIEPFPDINRL